MQQPDKFVAIKDLYLFCHQLTFRFLYVQPYFADRLPEDERQPFRDLPTQIRENESIR